MANELMRVLHAMMLDITSTGFVLGGGALSDPAHEPRALVRTHYKAQAVKDSGVDRHRSRGPERLAFLTGYVGENREQRPDIEWITEPCHLHGRSNTPLNPFQIGPSDTAAGGPKRLLLPAPHVGQDGPADHCGRADAIEGGDRLDIAASAPAGIRTTQATLRRRQF